MNKFIAFISIYIISSTSYCQGPVYQWSKSIGGGSNFESSYDAVADDDGNIYITGFFTDTVDFDPGPGVSELYGDDSYNCFILKLNPVGGFIWVIELTEESVFLGSNQLGSGIVIDNENNLIVTGSFFEEVDFDPGPGTQLITSAGYNDTFILKLDLDGNYIWVKTFEGSFTDAPWCIKVDASDNIFICGVFGGTTDFDPGPGVFNLVTNSGFFGTGFVVKLDKDGNFIWAHGLVDADNSHCASLVIDNSGNVIVASNFSGTTDVDPGPAVVNMTSLSVGYTDILIFKLDPNGNLIWAKKQGGIDLNEVRTITIDNDNSTYYSGRYRGTCDFDPGISTYDLTATGFDDIYISKLDVNGNFVWAKNFPGSTNGEHGQSLSINSDNEIYLAGDFTNTVDFDPGPSTYELTSFGFTDVFLLKLDSAGNFIWVDQIGSSGNVYVSSQYMKPDEVLVLTGSFTTDVDFDLGPTDAIHTPVGVSDVFIAKYADGFIDLIENPSEKPYYVFPNPVSNILYFEDIPVQIEEVIIYDLIGRLVLNSTIIDYNVNVSGLFPGFYEVKLIGPDDTYSFSILKK